MPKSIADLPTEILTAIFSHLDYTYYPTLSKVCRHWRIVINDPLLWRHSHFRTDQFIHRYNGSAITYSFLASVPHLYSITISESHTGRQIERIFDILSGHNPSNLHEIEVLAPLDMCMPYFEVCADKLPNIEIIKISEFYTFCPLFPVLRKYPRLKKLVLPKTLPTPAELGEMIQGCPNLQQLHMESNKLTQEHFMHILEHRDRFTNLTLCVKRLEIEQIQEFRTFANLQSLEIKECIATSDRLAVIAILPVLTGLVLQELPQSPVLTPTALTHFLRACTFDLVRVLKLNKTRLDDNGAAEIRRNFPELRHLEVDIYPKDPIRLTEKALMHFLHCKKLVYLEVLFTSSTDFDWVYRRRVYRNHDCDARRSCPKDLLWHLEMWDEMELTVW